MEGTVMKVGTIGEILEKMRSLDGRTLCLPLQPSEAFALLAILCSLMDPEEWLLFDLEAREGLFVISKKVVN
jgi:hypothetical protein